MDGTCHIAGKNLSEKPAEYLCIHSSQNIQDFIISKHLSQIKGNTLIQKTQGISHGPVAFFCHIAYSLLLCFHPFCCQKLGKSGSNGINGYPVKVIALTSGQYCDRYLVGLCSRQDKNNKAAPPMFSEEH